MPFALRVPRFDVRTMIALWKYVEGGEAPAGAEELGWDNKPRFRAVKSKRQKEVLQTG